MTGNATSNGCAATGHEGAKAAVGEYPGVRTRPTGLNFVAQLSIQGGKLLRKSLAACTYHYQSFTLVSLLNVNDTSNRASIMGIAR